MTQPLIRTGPRGPSGRVGATGATGQAAAIHAATCTALAASSVVGFAIGSIGWVTSLLDEFRYENPSTLTVDGITVLSVLNEPEGRWVRKNIPHPTWLAQTDWHWDFLTGNDEASGASGSPLKTHAEYQRRTGWHTYGVDQTWTFHADHPIEDQVSIMAAGFNGQQLKITAENGVIASGTFSGGATFHTGNEYWLLHDTNVPDWTPYVGKIIKFTSGAFANNAFAIILEDAADVGAGFVRVGQPYERTTSAFNDQARYTMTGTETYDIQDLVQISNIALNHQPSAIQGPSEPTGLPVLFDNLKLPDTAVLGFWDPCFCFARNCEIPNYGQLRTKFYSSNCVFSGDFWVPSPGSISQHQGPVIRAGFVFITGEIFFDDFPIFWHCTFGGDLSNATGPSWWHFHGGVALEECAPLDQGIFQAFRWECVVAGVIWGNNNTGDLFHIHPSMRVFTQSLLVTATFSGSFAKIANRTQVPAFDYDTQAFTGLRDTTYTNFQAAVNAGGFGGGMYDPQTLCGIWAVSS